MIPSVISGALTVQAAAAAPKTLIFMLVVLSVVIPVILVYTTYEFWVFRGKASRYYKREE